MCISATTNNAISNAIDKAHQCSKHIKMTREYSKKVEMEIDTKSKEISLWQMALNAEGHINLLMHTDVALSLDKYHSCEQKLRGEVEQRVV